jgi:hypothetical protein
MRVVQGAILARNLVIMYGSSCAPLSALTSALERQTEETPIEYKVGGGRMAVLLKQKIWASSRNLGHMVARFGDQGCSNSPDRLYALLGVSQERNDLEVDYKRSTSELVQYTLDHLNLQNYMFAPVIAEGIGIPMGDANSLLPADFLDKKWFVQQKMPYLLLRSEAHEQGDILLKTESPYKSDITSKNSMGFRRVYPRSAKLRPCTKGCSKIDAPCGGDIILDFPRSELMVLCPPVNGPNEFASIELKEDEIQVKIHAASLNYRELLIAKAKSFLCPISLSL